MAARSSLAVQPENLYELEFLRLLPCGCVVSLSKARLFKLLVVRLEAKGPFCSIPGHRVGTAVDTAEVFENGATGEPEE